jgi:hypothetical protein
LYWLFLWGQGYTQPGCKKDRHLITGGKTLPQPIDIAKLANKSMNYGRVKVKQFNTNVTMALCCTPLSQFINKVIHSFCG